MWCIDPAPLLLDCIEGVPGGLLIFMMVILKFEMFCLLP